MKLEVYTLEQKNKWDSIVKSFNQHDVYWLSGYVKAFQIHGDGEPMLFYFNDNQTRGINVVMKRDIAEEPFFSKKINRNTLFDFATPYGYGGWLIEGNDYKSLFSEYEEWCLKNNIVSEFVRFHPVVKNHMNCMNYYDVIKLGKVVTIDTTTPEKVWDNFTSQNRNKIRKAEKNDVFIKTGNTDEVFSSFIEIYNQTMDKDDATEYYYFKDDFYSSIKNDLTDNATVFYAVKDNQIIAATIILYCNGYMNYHLAGSRMEAMKYAPTNLMLYEAALWGCNRSFKTFYLGGGVGSGDDNLLTFKKSFNRSNELEHFFIGKKIFNQRKYDELVDYKNITSAEFFPEYRA